MSLIKQFYPQKHLKKGCYRCITFVKICRPQLTLMEDSKLIPSIHNYCDRWCERCVFIERCAVGIEELQRWKRETPMTDEEMWSTVSDNFKESLRMLDDMLREAGIDPAEVEAQPELTPNPDLEKLEEDIKQSLQQAEVLRQSILKKAFEGELV